MAPKVDTKRRKVNILDVAQASGVAPSTVSKVLSGKSSSPAIRKTILEAAERLGYKASYFGRSLRLGRSFTVGLVMTNISHPYNSEILAGAESVLAAAGYKLMLSNSDYSTEREMSYVQLLVDSNVDGVLLTPTSMESESVRLLQDTGTPLVLINRRHRKLNANLVGVDFADGTTKMLEHLAELGHTRIGLVTGRAGTSVTEARSNAFRVFHALRGITEPGPVIAAGYEIEDGKRAADEMLSAAKPPTAIIASEDYAAYGVALAAYERGLSVPEDLAVAGFDDLPVSSLPSIEMTSLRVPRRGIGEVAAKLLLECIDNPEMERREVLFKPALMPRASTMGKGASITPRSRGSRRHRSTKPAP